jgi:hypothetical protein
MVYEPARPLILSVTLGSGTAGVTWSATPGQDYRLQYKDNLEDTNWTDITPDVTSGGASVTATNLIGTAPQRFYRVMLVP